MVSVVKSVAIASWAVVTLITFWEAYYHSISAWDLFMYAMTSQICVSGPLASHIINFAQPRLAGAAGKYGPGVEAKVGTEKSS